MIEKLKLIYEREKFNPKLIGLIFNADFFERRSLFKRLGKLCPSLSGKLLDIGCGSMPYKELFSKTSEYIGVDLISSNNKMADVLYDGKTIPFDEKVFDSIFSTQVLMYVSDADSFLKEVNRITKTGGKFLISTPFMWHARNPDDCVRFSINGLSKLLISNGFEIINQKRSSNAIETLFQLTVLYFYNQYFIKNKILRKLSTLIFTIPLNLTGFILSYIFPTNRNFYLNTIILARKVNHIAKK